MLRIKKFYCYASGCTKRPSLGCKCSHPYVFSCPEHIEQHSKSIKSDHAIILSSTFALAGSNKTEAITKIDGYIEELTKIMEDSIEACSQIINLVNENLNTLIKKVTEMRFYMIEAKKIILDDMPIDEDFFPELMDGQRLSFKSNHQEILKKMSGLFSFEPLNVQDKFVFLFLKCMKELMTLDLHTLKTNSLSPDKKISRASVCKISHNKFFFHSYLGVNQNYAQISIIDLSNNTEEYLDNHAKKYCSSCICKDNQVYVFGGDTRTDQVSAKKFDLTTKKWFILTNLPISSQTASSLINGKIIISGFYFKCVYVYDNDLYSENVFLPQNRFYSCEKWIITNDKLYECEDLEKILWFGYPISLGKPPTLSYIHKKGIFLYFFDQEVILWRINTESKSANNINVF